MKFLQKLLFKSDDPCKHPYATATTPDRMIAAAICQSFIDTPEDWQRIYGTGEIPKTLSSNHRCKEVSKPPTNFRKSSSVTILQIKNEKKNLLLNWAVTEFETRTDSYKYFYYYQARPLELLSFDQAIPVDETSSKLILSTWVEIRKKLDKANEVAAKARAAMELNEKKWNLVENLLGMKRLPNGALVAVRNPEGASETCEHGNKKCKDIDCDRDCHCVPNSAEITVEEVLMADGRTKLVQKGPIKEWVSTAHETSLDIEDVDTDWMEE